LLQLVNQSPQGTKLYLEGPITSGAEDTQFLTGVHSTQGLLEVTLVNVSELSRTILIDLANHKDRLKFKVGNRRLWLYLQQLGFDASWTRPLVTQTLKPHIRALVIGGSTGSIEWLKSVLPGLELQEVSIFLILHQQPGRKSDLKSILQLSTTYKVTEPSSGTPIEPGYLYLAPADSHLVVSGGVIYLTKGLRVAGARPSIEVAYKSLAMEFLDNLLALTITGYGQDGAGAIKTLKQCGSLIWAEDPSQATASSLPKAIVDSGECHRVIKNEEIVNALNDILTPSEVAKILPGIESLLEQVKQVYGTNFKEYDWTSMSRRVSISMGRNGHSNLAHFQKELLTDPALFEDFLDDSSINVSSFFREPEQLTGLRERVFRYLETFTHCKVWCAGCAGGEEPFSLAILLEEAGLLEKTQIYATDFNQTILAQAQNGLIPEEGLASYKDNYLKAGGAKNFEDYLIPHAGFYEIVPQIRKKVLFFQHNLVSDSVMNEFQLVLLRNVMIYFQPSLQTKVLSLVHSSLVRGGFLLLGQCESLTSPHQSNFSQLEPRLKIFQKKFTPQAGML